jgi:hypothetical protein
LVTIRLQIRVGCFPIAGSRADSPVGEVLDGPQLEQGDLNSALPRIFPRTFRKLRAKVAGAA